MTTTRGSEPTRQVYKWLRGDNSVTKSKVDQVDNILPGSSVVFNLPLFDLLQNKTIRKSQLNRLISDYCDSDSLFWKLPKTYKGAPDGESLPIDSIYNVDLLYQRGGIFSFIAILYIVRLAEVKKDSFLHLKAVMYAYKSFPSLARHPDFIGHWEDILTAFIQVHHRVEITMLKLTPNFETIKEQIESKNFITLRKLRPRHPVTGHFMDNAPTFIETKFGPLENTNRTRHS